MKLDLESILKIIDLVNDSAPGIAGLIMSIKHSDGTETTVDLLNAADEQARANLAEILAHKAKEA
jgi:hypothetical protein